MSPRDPFPPTSIVLPPDIKEALRKRAQIEGRSLSNLIVYVLRQYVERISEPKRKSQKA